LNDYASRIVILAALVATAITSLSASAQPQNPPPNAPIAIVDSSTVYPFSTLVAEHFATSGDGRQHLEARP
jgi:ABC-type phosphate transport system substrate-binding protein